MKARIDHSIGAALQASASQVPAKESRPVSAPAARGPDLGHQSPVQRGRQIDRGRQDATGLHLTPRQLEVLALLCEGLPNKLICRRLDIAPGTVKVHISSLLREFGVGSRLEAVVEAQRRGVVKLEHAAMQMRRPDLLGKLPAVDSGSEATNQAMQAAAATVAAGAARGRGVVSAA